MGIFDNFMEGETGGMPNGIQGALSGNNPMLNIGLGILANNTGNYGSFGAAIGKGAQQGIQSSQEAKRMALQSAMYNLQMAKAKKELEKQKAQDEWLKTVGQPNATKTETTQLPDSWKNAPQGLDAPNFNMERVAGQTTTTETPYFDPNKMLLGGLQNGVIDFKDYIAATTKDKTPIKVGAGEVVLDPITLKPLFTAPNKEEPATSDIKNYQFAKNQGYAGTFEQFQIDQRKAGASSTNVTYGSPIAGTVNGKSVFFQPSKDGSPPSIIPNITPPKVDKPDTESQAKAGTFYSQMTSASKELEALSREGYDPTKAVAQVETSLAGGWTNPMASPKAQRAKQAQNQWAESFLRIKTGAAATQGEVDRNVQTFFPQLGDTQETITQKARARKQAEQDVLNMTSTSYKENAPKNAVPKAPLKPVNSKGWSLHVDAKGNQAYVSPDGKQFEEVK